MAGPTPQPPKSAPKPPKHDVVEVDGDVVEPTATRTGTGPKTSLPPDRPDPLTVRH